MEEECLCEPGNRNRSESSSVLFKAWSNYAKGAGHKPGTTSTFKDNLLRGRVQVLQRREGSGVLWD